MTCCESVTCFPALGTNFKYLLRVLIGYLIASACCNMSELESESVGFSSVRLNSYLNIVLTANSRRLTGHFRCLLWSYPGKAVKPTIFTTPHQAVPQEIMYCWIICINHLAMELRCSAQLTVPPGGGGTAIYGLYRYVPL